MEPIEYWILFLGVAAVLVVVLGAAGVMHQASTARRRPFPAPYRHITEPVRRHRRPRQWPGWVLDGWAELAIQIGQPS